MQTEQVCLQRCGLQHPAPPHGVSLHMKGMRRDIDAHCMRACWLNSRRPCPLLNFFLSKSGAVWCGPEWGKWNALWWYWLWW